MPQTNPNLSVKCSKVVGCNKPWRSDCLQCKTRQARALIEAISGHVREQQGAQENTLRMWGRQNQEFTFL
eukprot:6888037-Prorocentrum_lima.AAC.1